MEVMPDDPLSDVQHATDLAEANTTLFQKMLALGAHTEE
jgi:hypothetical protein